MKSRYLENETLLFLQIKKIINYTSRATLWQKNSFAVEVTFNALKSLISTNSMKYLSKESLVGSLPPFLNERTVY